jgi:cytochrome c-type biogenesis protein CcmH
VGRHAEAAAAFRRAGALDDSDPELLVAEGESLVFAGEGMVTAAAENAFRRALALAPGHPASRYYLGLGAWQAGNAKAAFGAWLALAADSAEDAPWRPTLLRGLEGIAEELDIDLEAVLPPPLPASARAATPPPSGEGAGPSEAEVRAAAQMSPEEREATIRTMVGQLAERLAEAPDDLEGWLRLGRARDVLGEPEAAREAYGRAAALAPDNPQVLAAYGTAIARETGPRAPVPDQALRLFERVLALDAGNPEALWFTGLAASEAGRAADAATAWQRLLERLAPDDPAYAAVTKRLEALAVE